MTRATSSTRLAVVAVGALESYVMTVADGTRLMEILSKARRVREDYGSAASRPMYTIEEPCAGMMTLISAGQLQDKPAAKKARAAKEEGGEA